MIDVWCDSMLLDVLAISRRLRRRLSKRRMRWRTTLRPWMSDPAMNPYGRNHNAQLYLTSCQQDEDGWITVKSRSK